MPRRTTTDHDGKFDFPHCGTGPHRIEASAPGLLRTMASARLTGVRIESGLVALSVSVDRVPEFSRSLRLRTAEGAILTGARVNDSWRGAKGWVTGPDCRVEIGPVRIGRHQLLVRDPRGVLLRTNPIEFGPAAPTTTIELHVAPTGRVQIGEPPGDHPLMLFTDAADQQQITSARPQTTITLPIGTYDASIRLASGDDLHRTVHVRPNQLVAIDG